MVPLEAIQNQMSQVTETSPVLLVVVVVVVAVAVAVAAAVVEA